MDDSDWAFSLSTYARVKKQADPISSAYKDLNGQNC